MSYSLPTDIISARNLTKRFGDFTAVNAISFTVRQGECFGLLGPNGAGKTSLARMVFGLSPRTEGRLTVFNQDISDHSREIKARLGVVAQEDNLDPELTVLENLLVYASYYRLPRSIARERAFEILDFMDLRSKANAVVDELSGGMKRRLTIGRALINRPELLILDEPTTGLDPYARHMVWQRLRQLKESGTTVLLTTHYLEEASHLCDRLIIINQGKILEQGVPEDLIDKHVGQYALELGVSPDMQNKLLHWSSEWLKSFQQIGDDLVLYSDNGPAMADDLNQRIAGEHLPVSYQRLRPTNLEDVFLKLTGETLHGVRGGFEKSYEER
ncbi:ABC transporter ATP-binding protein [Dehalobacter restrictus]|uniref:ABC transporter n=1 Tax=Dehalobacter restrictus (strain DSM 9455 / PER-K23) TaxID=871738 RepID=A0ABN4BRP8_DEHRP|nr:ABC transporter ATP-binding protein [Dehalobacter restrictus]AHF10058.1 ABC transporter [Dehalobacter restrictus DSM 9455]